MTLTIAGALDVAADSIRRTKERVVRERRPYTDTASYITAYRGADPVALVINPPDRDQMLNLARIAAAGFGADILSVAFETFYSTHHEISPYTGKPWAPGEMQELAEKHNGRERGWVSDALMVAVVNRAGDVTGAMLPYAVDFRRVTWTDAETPMEMQGLVPRVLVDAMTNLPPVDVILHTWGIDPGVQPTQVRTHIDCAVARHIRVTFPDAVVGLYARPADHGRVDVIAESLGKSALWFNGEGTS